MKIQILLLTGFFLFLAGCGSQDSGGGTEIVVPVSVEELTPKSIEAFTSTTGTVYPLQEAALLAELAGNYQLLVNPETKKSFALGDGVKKNQPIIEIKDPEFENNIKLNSIKLDLDISKQEFEKQQSLYEKGGVTLLEMKSAELAFVNAEYNYENALIQLAKMKVTSPFDGVIVNLPHYTNGTRVTSGQDIVTVMHYSELYLEANLPAKSMADIQEGQGVRIVNYSLPDDTLSGKITQVSPAIDPTTRTFKATMIVNNPDRLIRPGMYVKADIITAKKDSALVIPREIILSRQRGKTIFVVERGTARERRIETGLENLTEVEVLDGLSFDDRLIVKGFETLQNRSRIKVVQ